ncbi:heavy-metal-associated domain-containing protein [Sulfitobacter sp.]|uniref:heavy-metal-associated domain-containing protein n=1 Tax=Sulfitobacter sp. TaxID=1903071 RepID=UPI000C4FB142|nr:heavy metal-binding protein [Roseobacter sp.]MBV50274.1 heavy metal-binding protein [Roseobacter sp.]THF67789.1 MAG: heavy-metal-associated domain-containing protein [Sulfitobacter sp. SK025]
MTNFSVPKMSCGHCKASIGKAIASVDSDAEVDYDMTTRQIAVQSDADSDALIAAMKSAGYDAERVN